MSSEAVFNNPVGLATLSPVAIGDTVIALNQVVGVANTQFRLKIAAEIVLVTNGGGTATVTVTRGQESTTPNSYPAGMAVKLDLTAGGLINYISQQIAGTPSSGVQSVGAGSHVTVTGTAANPVVNASGVVQSVTAGTNVTVTGTTANPIINSSGGSGPTAPYFNVVDYGAVGDGTTDDTAAINAAITAADVFPKQGGVVWFPVGQYLVTSPLLDTTSGFGYFVTLKGAKASLSVDDIGSVIIYTGADGTAVYQGPAEDICFSNQSTAPVVLGIFGLNITSSSAPGVCRIIGCRFEGFATAVVATAEQKGMVQVNNCVFDSCVPVGPAGVVGISKTFGFFTIFISQNIFTNCTVSDAAGGLVWVQAATNDFEIVANHASGGTITNGVYVTTGASDYYAVVGNNFDVASTPISDNGTGTHKAIQSAAMKYS